MGRTGSLKARLADQPLRRRDLSVVYERSGISSHHSRLLSVLPSCVSGRACLLLRACWAGVAHIQLSGAYGPSLSKRSMLCSSDGRLPMSERKYSYEKRQRVQTAIPLAPYHWNPEWLGL
jgi:hypothetical protein